MLKQVKPISTPWLAIIKDGDYTLQKGVRLWSEKHGMEIPIIADIGHAMATAFKKQFEKTAAYKRFTTLINQGALCPKIPTLKNIPYTVRKKRQAFFDNVGSQKAGQT